MSRSQQGNEKGRIWPLVIAALALFAAFGSLQMILAALNVHLVSVAPAAPTSSHGVALVQASDNPAPVALSAIARPVDPDASAASMPNVSSTKEITLVSGEDARIRTLIHDSAHVLQPEAIHYTGALPTLVLPGRTAAYTTADLVQDGALVMLSTHVALLQENVFVASGARLSLGAPTLSALYMASSSSGFTSIVGWGGSLSFTGTAAQPLTIMSWNKAAKSAVADKGTGRPYIREIGATMTFANARVSALGFWSGRTGGVAWTGTSRASSKGSAVDSTFTGDTYGAFVSRGQSVTFSADRFESNELDGLHIHRNSVGSQVTSSSAARNGGTGFLVDRSTTNTLLRGDVSQHNAANGYLFDGRPLVSGASASGGSNLPSSGTVLQDSSATGNAHTSVLIEGGTGTVVKSDQFCSPTTAIALRTGTTNAVLTGNYIDCAPRSGISVGPSAPGTVIFGNIVTHPSIGLLIRNSGSVSMYDNRIIGATVFGVSARTATSRVGGVGNVMSGTGARAVDVRTDASVSGLTGTDTSGWTHHARVTFISYLEFHPLASLWLGILVVILLAAGWSFRRKLPAHPYPASVRSTYPVNAAEESNASAAPRPARLQPAVGRYMAPQPAPGRKTAFRPATGRHTASQPALGRQSAAQPAAVQQTALQPAVGRHTASQPALGRQSAAQPAAVQQTTFQPAAGHHTGPYPAGGRQAAPQPSAVRPSGSQPVAGRPPAAGPVMPPAVWNAPMWAAPGMPQPAPHQQPPQQHQHQHQQPALPPAPSPSHRGPAYREPAYREPPPRELAHREPVYHEPQYREPQYREPTYHEPAPGPGRWHQPATEPTPPGWDRPVHDAARWPQPVPARLPAPLSAPLPALPPALPPGASGGWPEVPVRHGGANGNRANGNRTTRDQQALPSEINRPYGRERPADPSGEDEHVTGPIAKGVWD